MAGGNNTKDPNIMKGRNQASDTEPKMVDTSATLKKIMLGGFGALLGLDDDNVDLSKFKTAAKYQKTYFSDINNIASYLSNVKDKGIEFKIVAGKGAENIATMLQELNKLQGTKKDAFVGIQYLYDFFENLAALDNVEGIQEKLSKLKNVIVNNKDGLAGLLNNIIEIMPKKSIETDISSLNSLLHSIITIISIDPASINLKGLRTLLKVTGKNGEIERLIEQLNNISKKEISRNNSIYVIETFFASLQKIGEIGLFERRRIKSNIAYFNKFIGDDIPALIDEINKSKGKVIESETVYAIESLENIFNSILKIGEIKFKDRLRIKLNLMYIRNFVADDLIELLNFIADKVHENAKEAISAVNDLATLFNMLFEIGGKSFGKMLKLSINLGILESIIKHQLIGEDSSEGIIGIIAGINNKKLQAAVNRAEKLSDLFTDLSYVINNDNVSLKGAILFLVTGKIINENLNTINDIIKNINKFKLESLEASIKRTEKLKVIIDNLMKIVSSLKGGSLGFMGGRGLSKTLDVLKNSIEKIKEICTELETVKGQELEKIKVVLDSFNSIILKSAAILLIGGLVMKRINPLSLIVFTACLGGFLWGITKIFQLMANTIKDDIKIAKEVTNLIIISGAILMVGGIVMNIVDPLDLASFAVTLAGLIIGISLAYLIFAQSKDEVVNAASDFSMLIAISGATLMAGGIIIAMGLGEGAKTFAWILGFFILGILAIFTVASLILKPSISAAKDIALLVGISGMTLMLGALFVSSPKRVLGVLLFASILWLFVTGILFAMKWAAADIKTSIGTMLAVSTLVAIAAYTLLIGAGLFTLFPKLPGNALLFTLVLSAFILAIAGICWLLDKWERHIRKGIFILADIVILLLMTTVAMGLLVAISYAAQAVGFENIIATLGVMTFTLIILTAICGVIGIPEVAGFVALGAVVVALVTIVLYLMIGALGALAAVIKYASTIDEEAVTKLFGKGLVDTGIFAQSVWGLVKLAPAFSALSTVSVFMLPGIIATLAICGALSSVAKIIAMWSELKIPEYGADGKIVGYIGISRDDFGRATDHIKEVLKSLFSGIKEVYNENKDIFNLDFSVDTFLTGKSPCARVISSSMKMGKMLSNIAQGVKMWSNLRIPVYDENTGKIKTYKTIDNSDFVKAGENIRDVITVLGQSIIDTYNSAPEGMFISKEWGGLGNTPFAKVAKAMKTMGPMLSSIAHGVQQWANLRIPVYDDETGKIKTYERLEGDKLIQAHANIIAVTSTLAEAILDVYSMNPDMFDDDSWHGFGDTPFAKVTKSLKSMGTALGNIADAVKMWSDLKIPIYGDSKDATKITAYKTITDDIFKTVSKNISYVVTMLAFSIAAIAKHPTYGKLFTNGTWFTGSSDVSKVLKSIKPLGSSLKDIADAIVAWSDLKIPVYSDDPKTPTKIVKYYKLTPADIEATKDNIAKVVKGLIEGIANVYNMKDENGFEYKTLFDSTGALFWKSESPVVKVLNAINPIGKALKGIADAVKAWAEIKVPIYGNSNSTEPTGYMAIGGETGINSAITNIQTVLRSIVSAIAGVYFGKIVITGGGYQGVVEYKKMFEGGDKSILNQVVKQLSTASNLISNVAKGISSIVALKIPVYNAKGKIIGYNNIERGDFAKVSTVIKNVITALGTAIVNVATDPSIDPKKNPNFGIAVDAIKSSTDILSSIADVIANFATGKFQVLEVVKGQLKPTKTIDITNKDIEANLRKNIINVLKVLGESVNTVISENGDFRNITDESKARIELIATTVVALLDNITKIYASVSKVHNSYTANAKAIQAFKTNEITELNDLLKAVSTIGTSISTEKTGLIQKALDIALPSLDSRKFEMTLSTYSNSLTRLITAIRAAQGISEDTYTTLKNGISGLYDEIKKVQYSKDFKQFGEELDDYIESINRIDLTRINSLKGFVDSMNALTMRLGNLDNLTAAISDKLSGVLLELVNQLRKADASIKNAHELQKKRKELIDNAVKEVKQIMNQKMIVEISQAAVNNNDDGKTPTPGGDTPKPTPSAGSDDEGLLNKPKNEETPTATEDGKLIGNPKDDGPKALTRSEFEKLMKEHMKGWKGGNIR